MTKIYSFTCQNSNLPAVFQCDNWTSQQVAEWLNGKELNIINGSITQFKVCTNEILEAVSIATSIINNSSNASMHIEVLNNVLGALASTYENTIRLIFWLERNPFVGNKKYAKMRNNLATYIDEMVDCVNNPNNPKFFSVPQLLIERAKLIQQVCNEIIHLPDPSILYTAFLDRVTIRRPATADWGFEIGRTCLGINLITRVDYNSPSAFPDKFDVGDEILEINGQSVIGWKRTSLLRRLNEKQPFLRPGQAQFSNLENVVTQLLLCKRPRESCSPHRFPKVQDCGNMGGDQEAKRLTKLALDFKNKIGTDFSMRWHRNQKECSKDMKRLETNNSNHLALRRVRSSSFTANVNSNSRRCSDCSLPQASRCISLLIPMGKQQLFRRASVWNESPPGTLHSPFKDSNSWLLLLASWGTDNRLTTATKPDRIQKRPPPLKGILEPGGVSVVVDKGETEDGQNGIVFSSVEIVPENELLKIGTSLAVIVEPEWSAPIKEITGISTQQRDPFSENTVNSLPVVSESPLSNIHAKIARFFYGEVSTPSPSPSGIIQQNSQPTTTSDPIIHIKTFLPKTNSECKTPITPNSKYSLELPFSSSTSTKLGEGSSSSLCSVDSPSYTSTIVKTASSSRNRLAPLAEPDEVGDLLLTYVPISASENALNKCLNSTNIPQNLQKSPIIEGLILRELFQSEYKRQIFRASFRRKRWTKCWGLIREGFFQIHSNQSSTEADFLIDLSLSTITTKPEIQTSKKHIFLLKNKNKGLKIHFALYSNEELNKWLEAIIQQQQSNLIMTSSTSSNECPNILQKSSSRASNNIESVSPPMIIHVVSGRQSPR
uniref:PDZ domain-containing protein n=1 Tax=Meloidogyne hapla TaxID=6305 RepID=A0A1I8B061_MELHA